MQTGGNCGWGHFAEISGIHQNGHVCVASILRKMIMSLLLDFQTQGLRKILYLQFLTSLNTCRHPHIPRRISKSTDQYNHLDENMLTKNFSHVTQTNYKHRKEKRKNSELTHTKLNLKRIKVLQQKIRRHTKNISSLKDIIDNLKRNH